MSMFLDRLCRDFQQRSFHTLRIEHGGGKAVANPKPPNQFSEVSRQKPHRIQLGQNHAVFSELQCAHDYSFPKNQSRATLLFALDQFS